MVSSLPFFASSVMTSPATLHVLLLCLLTASGEELFDRMVPGTLTRVNEIRKILAPIPDDILEEALYHIGSYYIPLDSQSQLCRNHSSFYFDSYLNNEFWAFKMLDASSKLPAGMMDGDIMDLGSFDQCVAVEAPGQLFRGQHCVIETKGVYPLEIIDSVNPKRPFLPSLRMDLMFSVCVPSSCSAADVKTHMDIALNSINASALIYNQSCTSTLDEPLEAAGWVTIFIVAIIILSVVLSTIYDITSNQSEKNPFLTAFSVSNNLSRMLDTRQSPTTLTCLNGLRVFAMAWIILGHRLLHMVTFPNFRLKSVLDRIFTLAFAPIQNYQLPVEIFFVISGVLVSYSFMRYRQKGKSFNLTNFYLYRYFRLTPALAMMALLYATVISRFTDGPLWKRMITPSVSFCQQNWWSTLLYVSNYVNPYEICMIQTWYLSADFQMYVFSPILLIPLYKRPRLGMVLTAGFLVLTTAGGMWNAIYYGLHAGGAITLQRETEVKNAKDYVITHFRAASFLMGIALGHLLFRIKYQQLIIKLSRGMLWFGWIVTLFLILFSACFVKVFEDEDYVYSPWLDTFYLVVHRHMFSLGVLWIIFVSTLGYGGVVDKFLSWKVFIPLARITYCVLLTHFLVQSVETYSQRTPINFNSLNLWYHFFADFTISHLTAAVLYLTVEAPFTNLTSWVFQEKKKPKASPESQTQQPVFKSIA